MSGDSGVLVVTRVRSTNTKCTRGRGCNGHPAFPTPSLGGTFINASGASRGGVVNACLEFSFLKKLNREFVGQSASVPTIIAKSRRGKVGTAQARLCLSTSSIKQARHRLFRRRAADRFGDQRRDRQRADIGRIAHRLGGLDR